MKNSDECYDKAGVHGFYVDPELLAHDLAIAKMMKMPELDGDADNHRFYDAYVELLQGFRAIVDDRTRYDSSFDK